MIGKIERPPVAAQPKVERTAPADAAAKVAPVAPRPAVTASFTNSLAIASAPPDGAHLPLSARPDALWGSPSGDNADDPAAIAAMSPAERTAKLAELQARKAEMQGKILDRVNDLEKKWESAPTATKAQALREYLEASQHLDPATRQQLRVKVEHAEACQKKIDHLQGKRAGLPPAREASPAMKAKRAELNKELRAARADQKTTGTAATKLIDDKGLKVDRLAVTEQVIDPSAPKAGSPDSLSGMLTDFFHLNWLTSFVEDFFSSQIDDNKKDLEKASDDARTRSLEDQSASRKRDRETASAKAIDAQRAQDKQVANRQALESLASALRQG